MNTPRRYHPVHVTLHWLIAIGVFLNLYLGILGFEKHPSGPAEAQTQNTLVLIHMATGILVLILLVARFLMRTTLELPAEVTSGNRLFDMLARLVHYGLYLTVLATTVLGIIFSLQTGRFQSAFFGAPPHFGPPSGGFNVKELHEWTAYALLGLAVLHILAALYHQFLQKDNLLARMWYGAR
jgi:cytochrome b561